MSDLTTKIAIALRQRRVDHDKHGGGGAAGPGGGVSALKKAVHAIKDFKKIANPNKGESQFPISDRQPEPGRRE